MRKVMKEVDKTIEELVGGQAGTEDGVK